MGEILLEAQNKELAIQAIRKEERYEQKINMLIDAEAWTEAVDETFLKRSQLLPTRPRPPRRAQSSRSASMPRA